MRKMLKRLRRDVQIAGLCRRVSRFGGRQYFAAFRRAVKACDKGRFTPREAFLLGLFKDGAQARKGDKIMSRKKLTKLQERVNPAAWMPFLKNKGIFYKYCMIHGVPIPQLYGLFFRDIAGWCRTGGNIVVGKADWIRYIAAELPEEFVVKPCVGAHGEGLVIFQRRDGGFVDSAGCWYEAEDVWRLLWNTSGSEGCVIQERMFNHPRIERLFGSKYLQTMRVVTFSGGEGTSPIIHVHLKLTSPGSIVDNFGDGVCGNIQCRVDLSSGRLQSAMRFADDGSGRVVIERHPETDICFEGIVLPYWEEVCRLAADVAKRFVPVRAIGWDVAVTPTGPVIVEGNIWWDPHNQHETMDRVYKCLGCS